MTEVRRLHRAGPARPLSDRASASVALALLAIFGFASIPALALEIPPPPTLWVTDRAAILPAADVASLNGKLQAFEQRSGAQFIIYILPTLGDEALEDFTQRAAQSWGAGQKKFNNGLVLFVFTTERKIRLEVGYGLEGTVTDALSSRVIRETLAPHFQKGAYSAGLNAAADQLISLIEKGEQPVPIAPSGSQQGEVSGVAVALIIIVLIVLLFTPAGRGCLWMFLTSGGGGVTMGRRGGGWSGGGGGGWSGGGGFSGGGGSFGGGGASGGW